MAGVKRFMSGSKLCSIVLSFYRSVVLSFYGSMVLWFFRSIVLLFYRSIVLSFYRSIVLLFYCSTVLLFHCSIVLLFYWQLCLWLACVGFTLGFGAMFVKTWRVFMIFLHQHKRKVNYLLKYICHKSFRFTILKI